MKTTLDLPRDLVREIKLRAVNDERKLKDTIADLLRKGLSTRVSRAVAKRNRVKLPLVHCRRAAELTPDRVAATLEKQDTEWLHEAARHCRVRDVH